MFDLLTGHFGCQHVADQGLGWAWGRPNARARRMYLSALREIEEQLQVSKDVIYAHGGASRILASRVGDLLERDFPAPPSAECWIHFARDCEKLDSVMRTAQHHLEPVIRRSAAEAVVGFYGGLKPYASVERKIQEYRHGRSELDLWDVVRFRIVVLNIQDVCRLGAEVLGLFRDAVVRLRNYYTRPKGPGNAYRAVHLEIDFGQEEPECVEVQFLTLARDAIGLIDHDSIYKHITGCYEMIDEQWVREMSYAANIADAKLN